MLPPATGGPAAAWLDAPAQTVLVEGCEIHYRRIGPPAGEPILLIHGGAAHAGWWLHVAPALARRHEVVVVELSGHGDSGHRDAYRPELWAREVTAVLEAAGGRAATVAGHSMGGLVGFYAAALAPELTRRLLLVDSVIRRGAPPPPPSTEVRYYASLEEGLANFRLRPRATLADAATLAAVARAGLRQTPAGWRWKFDPRTFRRFTREGIEDAARRVKAPIGLLYGGRSELASAAAADRLADVVGRPVARVEIPGAHHHVPLDAPAATVRAIEHLVTTLDGGDEENP
ncbi:alpha/beta hydrolase [Phytohabitans sp. ZYX-F-186]|uniref:Alpha/beta hydrolase n=1 Tax=Phytohabitans maris TaxID=3071409 RepID=A0ABU0ZA20_9ACTN|nr:alpha/beta hydrolase [Phytohabitans sp. ZYX-F-186]MDQ7903900.1 alpha/beta hydrolase [Phytohabitans sp. ZYX-F-186]